MTENRKDMSCEEFQSHLPELIGAGVDVSSHPHVLGCELCRALLADLEAIARAARELFPEVEPPDTLWDEIEDKLEMEGKSSPK
jgi:hypothetical protein